MNGGSLPPAARTGAARLPGVPFAGLLRSTGVKMFLILTLALLPLGLIALIASLQAIRTADLEKDALLRVAVTQSARKLTADLLSDRTALELTVNTLANDGGDQSICQRLELFLTSHDRDGGLFYIYDRRGKRLCGSAAPEPAGIVFGARFKGRAAQLLPASNVLVSRVRSRNGKLVGLAYYSQAHLESVADPATALQNRQLTLRQGDARMVISRPGGTQITGRASSLSARLDPPDMVLTMTVRDPPATLARLLSLFLPLVMWFAAAAVGAMRPSSMGSSVLNTICLILLQLIIHQI